MLHGVSFKTTAREMDQKRMYLTTDHSSEFNGVLLSILSSEMGKSTSLTDYFDNNKK